MGRNGRRAIRSMYLHASALGALLSAGCVGPTYAYRPAENVVPAREGEQAARYEIPAGDPAGTVHVVALGVQDLETEDGSVAALRARFVVENRRDDAGWTFDVREIEADMGAAGGQHPAFVNGSGSDLPVVRIERGQRRTVDVFFWLPETAPDAESMPAFRLVWTVRTGADRFQLWTTFHRVVVDEQPGWPAEVAFEPYWWYDPLLHGSPFHLGGPFGPSWYWGAGYSVGASWYGPPVHPAVPVVSHDRIPAVPRPVSAAGNRAPARPALPARVEPGPRGRAR